MLSEREPDIVFLSIGAIEDLTISMNTRARSFSIDRAGQCVHEVIEIDWALRAAEVETVFLREGVVNLTPTGECFRKIIASLAEFQRREIYQRLSKGKRRKAPKGGYIGGWMKGPSP